MELIILHRISIKLSGFAEYFEIIGDCTEIILPLISFVQSTEKATVCFALVFNYLCFDKTFKLFREIGWLLDFQIK